MEVLQISTIDCEQVKQRNGRTDEIKESELFIQSQVSYKNILYHPKALSHLLHTFLL